MKKNKRIHWHTSFRTGRQLRESMSDALSICPKIRLIQMRLALQLGPQKATNFNIAADDIIENVR